MPFYLDTENQFDCKFDWTSCELKPLVVYLGDHLVWTIADISLKCSLIKLAQNWMLLPENNLPYNAVYKRRARRPNLKKDSGPFTSGILHYFEYWLML